MGLWSRVLKDSSSGSGADRGMTWKGREAVTSLGQKLRAQLSPTELRNIRKPACKKSTENSFPIDKDNPEREQGLSFSSPTEKSLPPGFQGLDLQLQRAWGLAFPSLLQSRPGFKQESGQLAFSTLLKKIFCGRLFLGISTKPYFMLKSRCYFSRLYAWRLTEPARLVGLGAREWYTLFISKSSIQSQVCGTQLLIPALGKQMQEDHKFKDSMGYIVRSCFKKKDK